jgi:hypothetical protein
MEVNVNRLDYLELKRLYKKTVDEKKEMFVWKGQDILTQYAKYLIEYLEMQEFSEKR